MDRKRLIILISSVVVVLLVILCLWYFALFRLVSTDPSEKLSPDQTTIVFTYNHGLARSSTASLSGDIEYTTKIDGKQIIITLTKQVSIGQKIKVSITARDGYQTINTNKTFQVKYKDFSELSSAEQRRQTNHSDSFESQYPLVNSLPYTTDTYEITYQYPSNGMTKMPIIITVTEYNYDHPLDDADSPSYLAIYKRNRDAAIKYLKSKGFTTSKYQLYFTEPYLLKEYGAKDARLLI